MTNFISHLPSRTRVGLLALVSVLGLFALLGFVPPDGLEHYKVAQFLGRFHLLLIHFPIALILLVPVLELAGRTSYFPEASSSVDFVLALATASAIVASILGWCLAWSGGYSGALLTQHMWGGVSLAAASWLCWTLRGPTSGERASPIYALALIASVGLVSWTGYRGGQLSQGENHLTEYMPAGLRILLRLSSQGEATASANPGPDTFYGARIHPLFADHCVACHGPSKHKSNLRLDSYAGLVRGGKHGPVIKAGDSKGSELFHRVTLPPTDDNFMPAEHKQPLSNDQVKLIELWISNGASVTLAKDAIKDLPEAAPAAQVTEVNFEEINPAIVEKQRAPLAQVVAGFQKRFPGAIDYESRASADLVANMSLLGSTFTDEELAALKPLADHIVVADFSNTAITDRSAPAIAAMKRLRGLRLVRTKITDSTVQALATLDQLVSLSLFATRVTPAALPAVERMPKLRRLYAGETTITAQASLSDAMKDKVLF